MEDWFVHVLRYSRRDQLTLSYVFEKLPPGQIFVLQDNIYKTDLHHWPVKGYGRPKRYYQGYRPSRWSRRLERWAHRKDRLFRWLRLG